MINSRAVSIDVSHSELVDVSLAASRSPNSLMIAKYTSRVAKPCDHCHVVTDRAPPLSRTARRRRHGPRAAVVTDRPVVTGRAPPSSQVLPMVSIAPGWLDIPLSNCR